MFEEGSKCCTWHIDLATAIEINVLWRKFTIGGEIACCHGRGDAEPIYQVGAADIAEEPKAKLDESKSFALGLIQVFK